MDACTKCGICQAYCPVAIVTGGFPGPKYTGPQAQRFRAIGPVAEVSPDLCTGCGVCASVCPNDVAITDIITHAKAEAVNHGEKLSIGQRIVNRPETIGRLAGLAPWLVNLALGSRLVRKVVERLLGIHRNAPLPRIRGRVFARWLAARTQPEGPTLAYFAGCAVDNYDPDVGKALVRVLNRLGYRIETPTALCCALPMLSSGEWAPARKRAGRLVEALHPSAAAGRPIVTTSTSCSLALRSKYATYLDIDDGAANAVSNATVDICEFLRDRHADDLARDLKPMPIRILYHPPCQLRGHRMGLPAVELLRMIPQLEVVLSRSECCGIGGTFGYDRAKHQISRAIGETLVEQVLALKPDFVVCDSETCRWNIEERTSIPVIHPIQLIRSGLR